MNFFKKKKSPKVNDLYLNLRDGDFADFFAFSDFFFSASNLPHFCGFLQFRALHSNQRERNAEKNAYKITLTEPQREMRKNGSQKISLTEPQLREPLNCERYAQCTLSFC